MFDFCHLKTVQLSNKNSKNLQPHFLETRGMDASQASTIMTIIGPSQLVVIIFISLMGKLFEGKTVMASIVACIFVVLNNILHALAYTFLQFLLSAISKLYLIFTVFNCLNILSNYSKNNHAIQFSACYLEFFFHF